MNINIIQLLSVFDELHPLTDEEKGIYWFKTTRPDGLYITIAISVYECKVAISVYQNTGIAITSLHFTSCLEINVLNENLKHLEVLHGNGSGRCFLSLLGNPLLEYAD